MSTDDRQWSPEEMSQIQQKAACQQAQNSACQASGYIGDACGAGAAQGPSILGYAGQINQSTGLAQGLQGLMTNRQQLAKPPNPVETPLSQLLENRIKDAENELGRLRGLKNRLTTGGGINMSLQEMHDLLIPHSRFY